MCSFVVLVLRWEKRAGKEVNLKAEFYLTPLFVQTKKGIFFSFLEKARKTIESLVNIHISRQIISYSTCECNPIPNH